MLLNREQRVFAAMLGCRLNKWATEEGAETNWTKWPSSG
jgi:hypothetical protein